jgi:hypothetical protein
VAGEERGSTAQIHGEKVNLELLSVPSFDPQLEYNDHRVTGCLFAFKSSRGRFMSTDGKCPFTGAMTRNSAGGTSNQD